MPWKFQETEQYFEDVTTTFEKLSDKENVVVMGSNTWRCLRQKIQKRISVVISKHYDNVKTSNHNNPNYVMNSFEEFLFNCKPGQIFHNQTIFVIGGRKLITYAIRNYFNLIRNVFVMMIRNTFVTQLNDSTLQLSQFHELSLRKVGGFILPNCLNQIDNKYYEIEFIQYFNLESDEDLPSKIINDKTNLRSNQMNVKSLVSFNENNSDFFDIQLYQNSINDNSQYKSNCCCDQSENESNETCISPFCNSCIEQKCRCIFC
jgi:dihydrofolate reductase